MVPTFGPTPKRRLATVIPVTVGGAVTVVSLVRDAAVTLLVRTGRTLVASVRRPIVTLVRGAVIATIRGAVVTLLVRARPTLVANVRRPIIPTVGGAVVTLVGSAVVTLVRGAVVTTVRSAVVTLVRARGTLVACVRRAVGAGLTWITGGTTRDVATSARGAVLTRTSITPGAALGPIAARGSGPVPRTTVGARRAGGAWRPLRTIR